LAFLTPAIVLGQLAETFGQKWQTNKHKSRSSHGFNPRLILYHYPGIYVGFLARAKNYHAI
tara:strand:- start:332 stop:514 length:183 start_codon:yes stop_codon:yes gene_type:complete